MVCLFRSLSIPRLFLVGALSGYERVPQFLALILSCRQTRQRYRLSKNRHVWPLHGLCNEIFVDDAQNGIRPRLTNRLIYELRGESVYLIETYFLL